MVAHALAGGPHGSLTLERSDHAVPVEHGAVGQLFVDAGEAGFVSEQVSDLDLRFAGLSELRPVVQHRPFDIELVAVDQDGGRGGGDTLGRRVDVGDRVALPDARPPSVGVAAPEIDDGLASNDHTKRRADLIMIGPVGGEGVANRAEARIAGALEIDGWHFARSLFTLMQTAVPHIPVRAILAEVHSYSPPAGGRCHEVTEGGPFCAWVDGGAKIASDPLCLRHLPPLGGGRGVEARPLAS